MTVEWASAKTGGQVVGPGEFTDDEGSTVDDHAVLFGDDSTVVVEGTLDELADLASRILAGVHHARQAART